MFSVKMLPIFLNSRSQTLNMKIAVVSMTVPCVF